MTTQPTSNLQYSWSLDLKGVLLFDDFTVSWLTMTADLLISTGIGSTESYSEGPTTLHFVEVPTSFLVGVANELDFIVLELARAADMTLAHLRPACAGVEPVRDIAMEGVGS